MVEEGLDILLAHARLHTLVLLDSIVVSRHPDPEANEVVLRLTVVLDVPVDFSLDGSRLQISHGNVCRKHRKF